MSDDYCEMCDLPRSQCIHGQPPPPPAPVKTARSAAAPKPRKAATTTTAAASAKTRVVTTSTARRRTPPDELAPHILAILEDAGGEVPNDAMFEILEQTVGDHLLPGDHETTPEGELRWRYAARRARQRLVSEGVMTSGSPGVWRLA